MEEIKNENTSTKTEQNQPSNSQNTEKPQKILKPQEKENSKPKAPETPKEEKNCTNCRNPLQKSFLCKNCKKVRYCGRDCQVAHWKSGHKAECFAASIHNEDDFLHIHPRISELKIIKPLGTGNFSVNYLN